MSIKTLTDTVKKVEAASKRVAKTVARQDATWKPMTVAAAREMDRMMRGKLPRGARKVTL